MCVCVQVPVWVWWFPPSPQPIFPTPKIIIWSFDDNISGMCTTSTWRAQRQQRTCMTCAKTTTFHDALVGPLPTTTTTTTTTTTRTRTRRKRSVWPSLIGYFSFSSNFRHIRRFNTPPGPHNPATEIQCAEGPQSACSWRRNWSCPRCHGAHRRGKWC